MEKWFVTMKKADFQKIAEENHISPIVARLIRNRDVIGQEQIRQYLNGTMDDLYDGMLMKDMDKAVSILQKKIQENVPIRVIGDYDIDGVNATYILQTGLQRLGAVVDTDIPDRMKEGYGLNRTLIERAHEDHIDTIITCDNGIAAKDEIAFCKELGMTIIVTDHHEIPFTEKDGVKDYILPPADAVVDPHQEDCTYPFKGICGAVVAYKLMISLYKACGKDTAMLADLIENAAIATVGDVMDLIDENRIIVKTGLESLKTTQNLGLQALIECTGVDAEQLNAYHIGFVIGPCINASGRLDTAKRALELLNADSRREAVTLAEDLKSLNESRKEMTLKGVEQAIEQIENTDMLQDKVLVVYLPDCHESIAGIIAGRIRERYYRPVFVLTDAQEGAKGSGRSIDEYHMYNEMNKCKDLLTKFGGHKLAAGLSLKKENISLFRERLNELTTLGEEDLIEKVSIDMQLPIQYVSEALVEQLELLEPFGKGNVKPVFVEKDLKVIKPQIFGKNRNVLKFEVQDQNGNRMSAVYFGDVEGCYQAMQEKETMAFTYYPTINEYKGYRNVQIVVNRYR